MKMKIKIQTMGRKQITAQASELTMKDLRTRLIRNLPSLRNKAQTSFCCTKKCEEEVPKKNANRLIKTRLRMHSTTIPSTTRCWQTTMLSTKEWNDWDYCKNCRKNNKLRRSCHLNRISKIKMLKNYFHQIVLKLCQAVSNQQSRSIEKWIVMFSSYYHLKKRKTCQYKIQLTFRICLKSKATKIPLKHIN